MTKRKKPKKGTTVTVSDYNGHPSRHHWSVALNIANYEHIYTFALQCIREEPNLDFAARRFCACFLHDLTAERYEYTYDTVYRALEGLSS